MVVSADGVTIERAGKHAYAMTVASSRAAWSMRATHFTFARSATVDAE